MCVQLKRLAGVELIRGYPSSLTVARGRREQLASEEQRLDDTGVYTARRKVEKRECGSAFRRKTRIGLGAIFTYASFLRSISVFASNGDDGRGGNLVKGDAFSDCGKRPLIRLGREITAALAVRTARRKNDYPR